MGAQSTARKLALSFGLGAILAVLLPVWFHGKIIDHLGGAFPHDPEELESGLSPGARFLLQRAFEGIDPDRLFDHHTHVIGLGRGGTGCFVHPHMLSWRHPVARSKFLVYASAAGIRELGRADAQFVERLVRLARSNPRHGRHLILAFDQHYTPGGETDPSKTEFYTPNSYVVELAERHPDAFLPAVSIHPYRRDALPELDQWAARGVRFVKWLPNAMGIDPADPRCEAFYRQMKRHGMVLLTHAGDEKAVEAEEDQELGNPLRLRKPLDLGVKVVVAHCAGLGHGEDLDRPGDGRKENFELFLRLMDEKEYEGRLFGEISATLQFNRLPVPLLTLLRRRDLHHRLINGSDYPLPAINILVHTRALVAHGLVTEEERGLLNEIYGYNPLLFDFVAKRTLRLPGTREGFPPSVFMTHPDLPPGVL